MRTQLLPVGVASVLAAVVAGVVTVVPLLGPATSAGSAGSPAPPREAAVAVAARVAVAPPSRPTCAAGRVALSFDDGPSADGTTAAVVATLVREQVPATFFMVGSRVDEFPAKARRVASAGFAVGNHTYGHETLTRLSDAAIVRTVRRTQAALRRAGVPAPTTLRPPTGAVDSRVRRVVGGLGLGTALWTVDSRDWTGLSARQIRRGVVRDVQERGRAGSVVLLHDGVGNSPASAAALPRIISTLKASGYCFVALRPDGSPARR